MFEKKKLLITGGTGTFGHAVLDRMLDSSLEEIRIFSRDEAKQDLMRNTYDSSKLQFYLGDVREEDSLMDAMNGVDYVFHAAALKQVPSCEFYPLQAIRTNALGAENVINAAILGGVERVVFLSTDKAVYPINAMGMTKALMEKIMVARARVLKNERPVLCGTRYGNILCSRGSVIPLFISQIKAGLPLTVTDLAMTRFMMSVEGAVDLVIYAFENANPGDIFVQKAPAATIEVFTQALKEIFKAQNKIDIIGTRHGEKLFETLLTREEMARSVDLGPYYRIPADTRDLNYRVFFSEGQECVSSESDYTSHNTKRLNLEETKKMLLKIDYVQKEFNSRPRKYGL